MAPAALSAVGVVLIAEDFEDTREMYSYFLSMRGWQVVEAANGLEVLPLVAAHGPDVIFMDLSMPGIDGWELTQRLKADDATAHEPGQEQPLGRRHGARARRRAHRACAPGRARAGRGDGLRQLPEQAVPPGRPRA